MKKSLCQKFNTFPLWGIPHEHKMLCNYWAERGEGGENPRERKRALQEIRQPKINRSSRKNITKPLQPHSTSTEFQNLLQTIKKQNRHQGWDTVPK